MKGIISREYALAMAHALISAPKYDRETDARARGFLSLAERLPSGEGRPSPNTQARAAFEKFLRQGHETRDLGLGSPTQTTVTSVLVQQGFLESLIYALRQYDRLFDEDVCTVMKTKKGSPYNLPFVDDTNQTAVALAESALDSTGQIGNTGGDPTLKCQIGIPTTYRSQTVRVSIELVQDSGYDIVTMLTRAFAIRLSRGLGSALVSTLLSAAPVGLIATGSSPSTGGSETGGTSAGLADLAGLAASVDPAYRALPKCAFLMSSSTLLKLDSIITKQGLALFQEQYNTEGERLLLGFPVALCPNMPSIGLNATPIAFGALEYWITRLVEENSECLVFRERYAEYGEVGFAARLRGNGNLMGVVTRTLSPVTYDSPVKLLQNASS
jgi:HK97 family phage major capsid protein